MKTQQNRSSKLNRRDFLRLCAVTGAGVTLAGCGAAAPAVEEQPPEPTPAPAEPEVAEEQPPEPTEAPPEEPPSGEITVMVNTSLCSDEEIEAFNAEHPTIKATRVNPDYSRFFAMMAAGAPPEILRATANRVPQLISRKMLTNLQPYIDASDKLDENDLFEVQDLYRSDGTGLGMRQGDLYGLCKDWSPDLTIWVNRLIFEEAGIELPDPSESMTQQKVFDLARQTTQMEGDRVLITGYGTLQGNIPDYWGVWLSRMSESLYADDFSKFRLKDSEKMQEMMKGFCDLAKDRAMDSVINPSTAWPGGDFLEGRFAMVQYGFWYSGAIERSDTALTQAFMEEQKCAMFAGTTWEGEEPRIDPCVTATGLTVPAGSNEDAGYAFFEWYFTGDPVRSRAEDGWGIPPFKSYVELLPQDGPFRELVMPVLEQEMAIGTDAMEVNPFLFGNVIGDTILANWEPYLRDEMTFEAFVDVVQSEVEIAIQEGVERSI